MVNSTYVIRFKSGVTRQERTSQTATIHNAVCYKKLILENYE